MGINEYFINKKEIYSVMDLKYPENNYMLHF